MRQRIKHLMLRAFPKTATTLLCIRARRMIERSYKNRGLHAVSQDVYVRSGQRVAKGPFAGMLIPEDFLRLHIAPKLLGTYEQELHSIVDRMISNNRYNRVINIGCAEGYYAVGLAIRMPASVVFASDPDPKARRRTRRLAAANSVVVELRGVLDSSDIARLVDGPTLVVMDCEGAERVLLVAEHMVNCDIIVEMHPRVSPGIENFIRSDFSETHNVDVIPSTERHPIPGYASVAVSEFRGSPQSWAVLTRR